MDFGCEILSATKIHRCHRGRLEGCSNWEIPFDITRGAKSRMERMRPDRSDRRTLLSYLAADERRRGRTGTTFVSAFASEECLLVADNRIDGGLRTFDSS